MLNGIEPILIFEFAKKIKDVTKSNQIPLTADLATYLTLPRIPIYLSEKITGIYIDSEDRTIDIDTTTESVGLVSDTSKNPIVNQRAVSNSVKITMIASRDSIGMTILSAMADLIFPLVTSKEYSITYLHGAITVFSGFLHNFTITQNANDDLYHIVMELIKPGLASKILTNEIPAKSGAFTAGVKP